jgi:hypothetical protein
MPMTTAKQFLRGRNAPSLWEVYRMRLLCLMITCHARAFTLLLLSLALQYSTYLFALEALRSYGVRMYFMYS